MLEGLGWLRGRRRRVLTDREILQCIYDIYYDDYIKFSVRDPEKPQPQNTVYIPIDIGRIAEMLGADARILFGRIHYHLQQKFGYTYQEGDKQTRVPFFEPFFPTGERHCIHFALLEAVLADLKDKQARFLTATWISVAALIVSIVAISISYFGQSPS